MRLVTIAVAAVLLAACRYEPPPNGRENLSVRRPLVDLAELGPPTNIQHHSLVPSETKPVPSGWDSSLQAAPRPVGNGVTAPIVIVRVEPDIRACTGAMIRGIPIVEAVIDATGAVRDVHMVKPVHPCVDGPMVEAVKRWKFRPGTVNGEPVPVVFNLSMSIHWSR
jgi:hypothetical protein